MKLAVLGAGAVGLLSAFYLSHVCDVTVITRRPSQAEMLNTRGITLWKNGKKETREVRAATIMCEEQFDLCLVTVKQHHLDSVTHSIENLSCSRFLFLQNGMGHLAYLDKVSQSNDVFVGIVEHGTVKTSETEIIHTGNGCVKWGTYNNSDQSLLIRTFAKTRNFFPLVFMDDWRSLLTEKLLINACINPITALLNVKNGELLANPAYLAFMEHVYNEASSVSQVQDPQAVWQKVLSICEKTAENTSSMRADLLHRRKTEVDAILGYLINEANKMEKLVPHLSFLYDCIKTAE
jgi:2-dehydropantoate 2-reductase